MQCIIPSLSSIMAIQFAYFSFPSSHKSNLLPWTKRHFQTNSTILSLFVVPFFFLFSFLLPISVNDLFLSLNIRKPKHLVNYFSFFKHVMPRLWLSFGFSNFHQSHSALLKVQSPVHNYYYHLYYYYRYKLVSCHFSIVPSFSLSFFSSFFSSILFILPFLVLFVAFFLFCLIFFIKWF